MEAIIRIGARVDGAARLASLLRVLQPELREWIYPPIAHNRYRFGRSDMGATPDKNLRRRLETGDWSIFHSPAFV